MLGWFTRLMTRTPDTSGISFYNQPTRGLFGGLTYLNPHAYGGWAGKCPGCDLDVDRFYQLAHKSGVTGVVGHNEECTIEGSKAAVEKVSNGIKAGDLLVIYYSGHGGQTPDKEGDEPDRTDETLCLFDGQMTDDVVYEMLRKLPEGVRVFFVTDCCNSRSMARSTPPVVEALQRAVYGLGCEVIHFAGCDDGESSFGGSNGGIFTNALLATYKPTLTYEAWFDAATRRMPANQVPYYTEYNVSDAFRKAAVFH